MSSHKQPNDITSTRVMHSLHAESKPCGPLGWRRTLTATSLALSLFGCATANPTGRFVPSTTHVGTRAVAPAEVPVEKPLPVASQNGEESVEAPTKPSRDTRLTRRLFRGQHPTPVPKGGFDYRAMGLITEGDLGVNFGLDYGVTDDWTLGVIAGADPKSSTLFDVDTGDEISVGTMYRVLGKEDMELSLRLDLAFRDDSRLSDHVEWVPSVVYGNALGDGELYLNMGGAFIDQGRRFSPRFQYGAAYVTPINSKINAMVEIDGDLGDVHDLYLTPGIVFNTHKRLQIQFASAFGLTNDSDDYQLLASLIVGF